METPDFTGRQFAVYGMWRSHQLEFNRDGKMTRLVITWSREAYRDEWGALHKCVGGALFDPERTFTKGENQQFFFFTKGTEVQDVLEQLNKLEEVVFIHCNPPLP